MHQSNNQYYALKLNNCSSLESTQKKEHTNAQKNPFQLKDYGELTGDKKAILPRQQMLAIQIQSIRIEHTDKHVENLLFEPLL